MDERVKNTYQKIYAELFRLVLVGCALSLIIKFAVLGMSAVSCIPEYPILVGSPIYLVIRSRMLGVTQVSLTGSGSQSDSRTAGRNRKTCRWHIWGMPGKRKQMLICTCSLLIALFVFTLIMRNQGERMDLVSAAAFALPFIACFLLAQMGFRKLEERRQKKLDDQYDDK